MFTDSLSEEFTQSYTERVIMVDGIGTAIPFTYTQCFQVCVKMRK